MLKKPKAGNFDRELIAIVRFRKIHVRKYEKGKIDEDENIKHVGCGCDVVYANAVRGFSV